MGLGRRIGATWLVVLSSFATEARARPADEWREISSPHFIVVSNAGEQRAREIAAQFEQFRAVLQFALPHTQLDPGRPVIVWALRTEDDMRQLLPSYWEQEGRARPRGVFVSGPERHYAVLLLDTPEANPYHNLYHEYVHLLNKINFAELPVWLNEGLAELYATARIGARAAELGRPDTEHLGLLRERPLMPLESLFAVDHSSPEYNEADKVSLFYAQSWALTHMLLFEAGGASPLGPPAFPKFLDLISRGVPSADAIRQVFGEPDKIERDLRDYCHLMRYRTVTLQAPPGIFPHKFRSRELSPAELAALRGDFLLHTHRSAEARAFLEEALRLNPRLAIAQETLAGLYLQEGKEEEAFHLLRQALENGSSSYFAHYNFAVLLAEHSEGPAELELARLHLEETLRINPEFAPAYHALSSFFVTRAKTLDEALQLARKAASLDPTTSEYALNVARILLRMQRVDEAIETGQHVVELAATPDERDNALDFLDLARKYKEELTAWKHAEESAAADAAAALQKKQATETGTKPPAQGAIGARQAVPAGGAPAEAPTLPPMPRWGAGRKRRVVGSAVEGWITSVTCKEKSMDLALSLGGYYLDLHSSDYFELGFLTTGWAFPDDFDPCKHLKGMRATVIYRAMEGKSYAGEILSIVLRK